MEQKNQPQQRKSSHQPYGSINEVLDEEQSFIDFFAQRQLSKVREAVNAELEAEAIEEKQN